MLLALQLSLQLDDVLKVLEAVPDSGKGKGKKKTKKPQENMIWWLFFTTLIIGIFRETIISSKTNSLPELLKD